MAAALDMPVERVAGWGLVRAVLAEAWHVQDTGRVAGGALQVAEQRPDRRPPVGSSTRVPRWTRISDRPRVRDGLILSGRLVGRTADFGIDNSDV